MRKSGPPQQNKKYQDVIDYKPVILKVIKGEKSSKLLENPNYGIMLPILRKGPMTVQEITKAFNEIAKNSSSINKKSFKSIYRYLNALEEVGVVATAGQRVVMGKTATEKLFSRTARVFELRLKYIDWMGEEGNEWAERFGTLVGHMLDIKQVPSVKCIQEFFEKWNKARLIATEKLASIVPDDEMETITTCDLRELTETFARVYIFSTLLNQPDLLEQIRRCFEGKTH
ncbi:MAG: hypothetical protein ACXADY_04585 [Candidatus Hodarchaeales archaeon]|jgi:DNA-binding PadR family transcriptional regulator